jgi:hypothetical protein
MSGCGCECTRQMMRELEPIALLFSIKNSRSARSGKPGVKKSARRMLSILSELTAICAGFGIVNGDDSFRCSAL